jgi:hypothetical protein
MSGRGKFYPHIATVYSGTQAGKKLGDPCYLRKNRIAVSACEWCGFPDFAERNPLLQADGMKIRVRSGILFRREGERRVVTVGYGSIFAHTHTHTHIASHFIPSILKIACNIT